MRNAGKSLSAIARKNIIANMKKLQESGLIKRVGAGKNGHWQAEE